MTENLKALWELTGISLDENSPEFNGYFDPIGLILLGKPVKWDYCDTPINSMTFATTGGDGVHFGLIDIGGGFTDTSPVVMTVPMSMCDPASIVVGESLLDFLALGCRQGYFTLENLVYPRNTKAATLDTHEFDPGVTELKRGMLESICRRFGISPWILHASKLSDLQARFMHYVQIDGES